MYCRVAFKGRVVGYCKIGKPRRQTQLAEPAAQTATSRGLWKQRGNVKAEAVQRFFFKEFVCQLEVRIKDGDRAGF